MRLLIVTGIFPPDIGGPATYVPAIAEGLAAKNHQIAVLTWSAQSVNSSVSYPVYRIRRQSPKLLRAAETLWKILLHGRGCDLIYAQGLWIETALASQLLRKPWVAKVVGDWAWEKARNLGYTQDGLEAFQQKNYGLRIAILRRLRTWALFQANRWIVPSQYLKNLLVPWGIPEAKIHVIPNAVSPEPLTPHNGSNPNGKRHQIITAGRLVPWKGFHEIIEVISELPDCDLLIAGKGPEEASLKRLAIFKNVVDRVHFAGPLRKQDLLQQLSRSTAFVLNSRYEGFPHVLLEALGVGVPVLCANTGGVSEIVRDGFNGILYPVGDAAELKKALQALLKESGLRKHLSKNAKESVQGFSLRRMSESTERVLLEVSRIDLSRKKSNVLLFSFDTSILLSPEQRRGGGRPRLETYSKMIQKESPGSNILAIVYAPKKLGLKPEWITDNLYAQPSNSLCRFLFFWDAIRRGLRLMRRYPCAVITTQSPFDDAWAGWILKKISGAKLSVQIHNDFFAEDWLQERPIRKWGVALFSFLLKRADSIRVVSSPLKAKLEDLGIPPDRVLILPVGASLKPSSAPATDRNSLKHKLLSKAGTRPVILTVARLCPQKNPNLLVRSAALLLQKTPNFICLWIGEGPSYQETKREIEKQKLDDHFLLLRDVSDDQLSSYYALADIFALPSRYEGFGKVILEAYLFSLPVVATQVTGPGDIILNGETGFLVPPQDPETLAEKLLVLLRDERKRREMGLLGQQRVQRAFDSEKLMGEFVRSWLRLIPNCDAKKN